MTSRDLLPESICRNCEGLCCTPPARCSQGSRLRSTGICLSVLPQRLEISFALPPQQAGLKFRVFFTQTKALYISMYKDEIRVHEIL